MTKHTESSTFTQANGNGTVQDSRKRRVAYFFRSTGFGGLELYLLSLLRSVDRARFDVLVFFHSTDADSRAVLLKEFSTLEVEVRGMDARGVPAAKEKEEELLLSSQSGFPGIGLGQQKSVGRRTLFDLPTTLWSYWCRVQEAAARLRQERIGAVHFIGGWFPVFELAVIGSRLAGIPIRLMDVLQEPRDIRELELERRWLAGLAGRSTTHARVMNRTMGNQLATQYSIDQRKIRLLFGVVGLERFIQVTPHPTLKQRLGIPPQARVVVTVGRLGEYKGYELLLEAIRALRNKFSHVRYVIVGDGPLRASLTATAASWGLLDQVQFVGFQEHIPDFISIADVFVMPSVREGGPFVVAEAMAAGKPVIATNVGFVKEVLVDGAMGRVIPPNSVADLVRAMDELLAADEATLKRTGKAAREHIQRHLLREPWRETLLSAYETNGDGWRT